MCVIIHKPAEIKPEKGFFESAWKRNPDGAGYAINFGDARGWIVQKGFMTFEAFWANYEKHIELEAVLHFRVATHGEVLPENTHPFLSKHGMIFFHNGVISEFGSKEGKLSDSKDFFYNCLSRVKKQYRKNVLLLAAGFRNKFVLIHEDDTITFVGDFEKHEGMSLSNKFFINSFTPANSTHYYPGGRNVYRDGRSVWHSNNCVCDECLELKKDIPPPDEKNTVEAITPQEGNLLGRIGRIEKNGKFDVVRWGDTHRRGWASDEHLIVLPLSTWERDNREFMQEFRVIQNHPSMTWGEKRNTIREIRRDYEDERIEEIKDAERILQR